MESTVGTPPSTVVVSAYCFPYKSVFSLAPKSLSIGSMKTSVSKENTSAEIQAMATL